jgi:hypothetical protein
MLLYRMGIALVSIAWCMAPRTEMEQILKRLGANRVPLGHRNIGAKG